MLPRLHSSEVRDVRSRLLQTFIAAAARATERERESEAFGAKKSETGRIVSEGPSKELSG